MTMEILQTIALLCQLSGQDPKAVENKQLECQKYYIKCLGTDAYLSEYKTLSKCLMERK